MIRPLLDPAMRVEGPQVGQVALAMRLVRADARRVVVADAHGLVVVHRDRLVLQRVLALRERREGNGIFDDWTGAVEQIEFDFDARENHQIAALLREAAELYHGKLGTPERAVPVLEKATALVPEDRELRRMLAEGLRVALDAWPRPQGKASKTRKRRRRGR